jgi:hypothetical protein
METKLNYIEKRVHSICPIHKDEISEFFCSCRKILCSKCIASHENHENFLLRKRNDINSHLEKDLKKVKSHLKNYGGNKKEMGKEKNDLLKSIEAVNDEVFKELVIQDEIEILKREIAELLREPTEERKINFLCNQEKLKIFNIENLERKNYGACPTLDYPIFLHIEKEKNKFIDEYKSLLRKYMLQNLNTYDSIIKSKEEKSYLNREDLIFSFKPVKIKNQKEEENSLVRNKSQSEVNNLNDSTFITKIKLNENSFINKHIFEENIFNNRKNSDENEITITKKLNLDDYPPRNLKTSVESLFAYDNFEVGNTLNDESLQFSIKEKENHYKENLNFNKTIYFSKVSKMQVKCEKCSKYFGILKSEKNCKKICEKCSF